MKRPEIGSLYNHNNNIEKNTIYYCINKRKYVPLQPLSEQALVKKQVERLTYMVKCSRLTDNNVIKQK